MSIDEKINRRAKFRHYAVAAKENAKTNQRRGTYNDGDNVYNPLTALAKEFDPKLHEKISKVNAAHRDLDTYIIEAFKEADGNGTANNG